jgi:hypothetical protein
MVTDLVAHAMTNVTKPSLGATFTDPQFGTKARRITAVTGSGSDAALVPMYTTISAWNADESRLILYAVNGGVGHQLYDGKTYQLIKTLDINPADLEQVYWDTSDPALLYPTDGQELIRHHVSAAKQDQLHDFSSLCGSSTPTNGDDPMFTSRDSHRLGLTCGEKMFIYDSSTEVGCHRRPGAVRRLRNKPTTPIPIPSHSGTSDCARVNPRATPKFVAGPPASTQPVC